MPAEYQPRYRHRGFASLLQRIGEAAPATPKANPITVSHVTPNPPRLMPDCSAGRNYWFRNKVRRTRCSIFDSEM
jgi:hypothetical protein